jgi:hypothetical protein
VLYHESIRIDTQASGNGQQRMRLDAYGQRFELLLQPNEGIRRAVPAGRSDIEPLKGTVEGQSASWVRMTRTRAGWRGMLFDGHELYAIEPASDIAEALVQPLAPGSPSSPVMYRLADTLVDVGAGFCATLTADTIAAATPPGTGGSSAAPVSDGPNKHTALKVFDAIADDLTNAAAQFPTRQLMTGVVADYEFASHFDDPQGAIIARMDIVDGIFSSQVGVKISLAPVTVITTPQEPFTATDAGDLLTQLRTYRSHSSSQLALGVTHLMTGRDLDGDTVGIAYQGTVCNGTNAASLSEGTHSTTISALIAAHELGHNFNAPHDGVPGACASTPQTFLMAPQINGSSQFSSCSIQQIQARIQTAQCLLNYVPPDVTISVPVNVIGASLNSPFTVSYSVNAAGDDPSNDVVATATLPSNLTVQSATMVGGSCSTGAGTVSCSTATLATGASSQISLQLLAGATGASNLVLAVTSSNDSVTANDSGQVTINISNTSAATAPADGSGGGGGGGSLDFTMLAALTLLLAGSSMRRLARPAVRPS